MKSLLLLILAGALLSGCLYVHTVDPLTTDMHQTPTGTVEKTGTAEVIAFPPFLGSYPLIAWGKAAIGEVAKKEAMTEVYYADVETFSILRIYNRYTVHVYGK
jgi:hypothetical protein